MEEQNKILKVPEVMAILGFTYRTILELIKAGTLPAAKIGRHYRIQSKDLYAMLDANKRPAPEDKP